MKVCPWLYLLELQLHSLYHKLFFKKRFWENIPAPFLILLWFFCLWRGGLEIHSGNKFNAVLQTRFTNVRKLVVLFFEILPHSHDQITMNGISLMIVCWMQFHLLSNGLIIGFKRPILMIDVCWYKNSTCCLIQTINWLLLSWMSHLIWFLWGWTQDYQY